MVNTFDDEHGDEPVVPELVGPRVDTSLPGRARQVPTQITDRTRALIDAALDKVFAEPFDIRTAEDFERAMAAGPGTSGMLNPGMAKYVELALMWTLRSKRIAGKLPFPAARVTKWGLAAVPFALEIGRSARRGVRELQLLASLVMERLRAAGVTPDRNLVRAITLSLAVDPDRRVDPTYTPSRAASALAGIWLKRGLGKDGDRAIRRRVRAQLDALDRLDLGRLALEPRSGLDATR